MRRNRAKSTEEGLTLIESLAAIVIFGLAVVAISPPIALSLAARVRAHRAEQALNLAQGEIDRVRLLVEQGNQGFDPDVFTDLLPPKGEDGDVPTSRVNCSPHPLADDAKKACEVDIDGNGTIENMDFIVQTFRTANQCEDANIKKINVKIPVGFKMVVRVYTVASFDSNPVLSPQQGSLAFSGATTSGPTPLAVLSSTLVRSDLASSSDAYQKVLKGEDNCTEEP